MKYTLLPLIFYYVFIKRSFMHTNTYLIQRLSFYVYSTVGRVLYLYYKNK